MNIVYLRYPPATWMLEPCHGCRSIDRELCDDGYCKPCHKSLSFESCLDGSWADGMYAGTGVAPPRFREGREGQWSNRIAAPEARSRNVEGT
jgi:hypothetical protein